MSRAFITRTAAVLWLVVGCAAPPPDSERVDESIVITKHAPGVEFGSYQTYYLRPEVRTFDDKGEQDELDEATAEPLLEQTRKNLEARGYVEADKEEAELGVQVMYTDKITTTYWCYYWWDPYYWGYPGWGYYPYYGCDYSAWKSEMLGTVIVDLKRAVEENPDLGQGGEGGQGPQDLLPGIWFSGVYGVSLTSKEARDGIDQAFKQSPYLRAD
jgi:hypothetical protein